MERGRKGRGLRRKAGVRMDKNSSRASDGKAALRQGEYGTDEGGAGLTERSLGG